MVSQPSTNASFVLWDSLQINVEVWCSVKCPSTIILGVEVMFWAIFCYISDVPFFEDRPTVVKTCRIWAYVNLHELGIVTTNYQQQTCSKQHGIEIYSNSSLPVTALKQCLASWLTCLRQGPPDFFLKCLWKWFGLTNLLPVLKNLQYPAMIWGFPWMWIPSNGPPNGWFIRKYH